MMYLYVPRRLYTYVREQARRFELSVFEERGFWARLMRLSGDYEKLAEFTQETEGVLGETVRDVWEFSVPVHDQAKVDALINGIQNQANHNFVSTYKNGTYRVFAEPHALDDFRTMVRSITSAP